MKIKLIHTTSGVSKKTIADLENFEGYEEIKYRESPGIKVLLRIYSDSIEVKKIGNVNVCAVHKLHQKEKINFTIKMEGQEFSGSNNIRTTRLEIKPGIIKVEYKRDKDIVVQSWNYE